MAFPSSPSNGDVYKGWVYNSSGGYGGNRNEIDKCSFTSDGNATDVGNLSVAREGPSGQQY